MSEINTVEIKDRLLAERDQLLNKLKDNDLSVDASETPDPVDLAVRNYSKKRDARRLGKREQSAFND